jgi:hypothetical protein
MPIQIRQYTRPLGAVILPGGLLAVLALTWMNMSQTAVPEYPALADPKFGDLVVYYDKRMAPIREALLPFQEVSCCVDNIIDRANMRGGLQHDAAQYALLPSRTRKAGQSDLIVLDFDSEDDLQVALPFINGDLVVHPGNGTGLVKLRQTNAPPATTIPKPTPGSALPSGSPDSPKASDPSQGPGKP